MSASTPHPRSSPSSRRSTPTSTPSCAPSDPTAPRPQTKTNPQTPTTLFGLGAGEGGLSAFCDHFADTFNGWWADLGSPQLHDANAKLLEEGLAEANEGLTVAELSQKRDAMLVAIQRALAELEPD